jgi:hypothetical protein
MARPVANAAGMQSTPPIRLVERIVQKTDPNSGTRVAWKSACISTGTAIVLSASRRPLRSASSAAASTFGSSSLRPRGKSSRCSSRNARGRRGQRGERPTRSRRARRAAATPTPASAPAAMANARPIAIASAGALMA